jgi:hypothetical protein
MSEGTRLDRSNRSKVQELAGVPGVTTRGNICLDTAAGDLYVKFGASWILVDSGTADTTLDDAYNNFTSVATVTVDAKDVSWVLVNEYSFVVNIEKCAKTSDGFHVLDGADYFKLNHVKASGMKLLASLEDATIETSGHIHLLPSALGIGTLNPTAYTDIEYEGTVSDDTALLEVCNSANAASMANTETSIVWKQYYYDAVRPAEAYSGKITVGTVGNWTSTTRTQMSFMTLNTRDEDSWVEVMRLTNSGYVGIGCDNPSAYLDIEGGNAPTAPTVFIELTNTANDASMTGTGAAILFNQFYYDAYPDYRPAARIMALTETNWTSAEAGSNAALVFETVLNATLTERARLTSGGNWCIGLADCEAGSRYVLGISNGIAPDDHVDNAIQIYSVDSSDSTATLGLYLEQAIEEVGTFTPSHKIKIKINGTEYWVQLDAV